LEKLEEYYGPIREHAGNIPIILVGNKKDLEKELGVLIEKRIILEIAYRYNLIEYIETSALTGRNISKLFRQMAILALMELQSPPQLGQVVDKDTFQFKVVLAGPAAVGKSTILKTFIDEEFTERYELTVGIDQLTQTFEIPDEEISEEVKKSINKAIRSVKKLKKKEGIEELKKTEISSITFQEEIRDETGSKSSNRVFNRKFTLFVILIIITIIVIVWIIQFI